MSRSFGDIAFTPAVQAVQVSRGSRRAYAAQAARTDGDDRLGDEEIAFITARDSMYMASVGETGWPYVQHRGGPVGFLNVIDDRTIGFADYSGNRQYISEGNVAGDDRVCLFLMDYPHRARLKIYGHARITETPERGWVIRVAAFDWNCQKYIVQRFTRADVDGIIAKVVAPLEARIAELEGQLARQET